MMRNQCLFFCILIASTAAFSAQTKLDSPPTRDGVKCWSSRGDDACSGLSSRRIILFQGISIFATFPSLAFAASDITGIPMLTTDEFLVILRDSARSIQRVEFDGPKSETVTVKLIDGTTFGLSDVIESPTDPRSPLKVQAACREAKVPFKNLQMEAILATAPKKTKLYTNQRVQDAQVKEKERLERLAQDEEERLAALFKMEQEEAAKTTAASRGPSS